MRGRRLTTRRSFVIASVLGILALAPLAAAAFASLSWQDLGLLHLLILAGVVVGLVALWTIITLADDHFDGLARLTGDVLGAQDEGRLPPRWAEPGPSGELVRLAGAMQQALARAEWRSGTADQRLAAVVAVAREGLVVVTESGLVSLVNAAAQTCFPHSLAVGTSIFGAIDRDSLLVAEAEARAAGGSAEVSLALIDGGEIKARLAELAEHGGLVLSLLEASPTAPALAHDLSLHDAPPTPILEQTTPLSALPAVVLDGETTGLDVENDRLVSLAALVMHGTRLYPARALDRLVNPGVAIPKGAMAVHGISDAMVAGQPPVAVVLPELGALLRGRVAIGHNIGFDLALIAAEAKRAGLIWRQPPALDTGHLAAALHGELRDLNLETLARHYGLPIEGRHTALGDCLLTATVWRRLLRELEARGVQSFGEAEAFARRAERLIAPQRAAGWVVPA